MALNIFLKSLVDELKELWNGIRFSTFDSPIFKFQYRVALLCVACDIQLPGRFVVLKVMRLRMDVLNVLRNFLVA